MTNSNHYYYLEISVKDWSAELTKLDRGNSPVITKKMINKFAHGSIEKFVTPVTPRLGAVLHFMRTEGYISHTATMGRSIRMGKNGLLISYAARRKSIFNTEHVAEEGEHSFYEVKEVKEGGCCFKIKFDAVIKCLGMKEEEVVIMCRGQPTLPIGELIERQVPQDSNSQNTTLLSKFKQVVEGKNN